MVNLILSLLSKVGERVIAEKHLLYFIYIGKATTEARKSCPKILIDNCLVLKPLTQ